MTLLTSYICLAVVLHQFGWVSAQYMTLLTITAERQNEIVDMHNKLRRSVKPSARNMLKMGWRPHIASSAQGWADECILEHSNPETRIVEGMKCGENLFFTNQLTTWSEVIKLWYSEEKNFVYGSGAKSKDAAISNYTQVVWYNSFLVGCGISRCNLKPNYKYKYHYVCHYAYAGNIEHLMPTPYKTGSPCADCPNACDNGLCTNPCRHQNNYKDCPELKAKGGCSDETTKNNCKASCLCTSEII